MRVGASGVIVGSLVSCASGPVQSPAPAIPPGPAAPARAGGPEVIGYFHSHPTGDPVPSMTDCASASGDGRIWAIIADKDVRFWMDGEQGFAALSFAIIES